MDKGIAIKNEEFYDTAFILLDTDKEWPEEVVAKALANGFNELIGSVPCIEGLLITILELDFNATSKDTDFCKKYFDEHYLGKLKDKLIAENYSRIFTKDILDERRKRVAVLDKIINYMTSA